MLSSEARKTTALATSSDVPSLPSGALVRIAFKPSRPAPADATASFNPGVSMRTGLTAFTRMRRCFKSVVQIRAKQRTAALLALETVPAPNPLLAPMAAFRMIEAPSGSNGSAFCTVKSRPFHVDVEDRVVELLGDGAQGRKL